jgi:peptide/nickel transport system ATP-binding protein
MNNDQLLHRQTDGACPDARSRSQDPVLDVRNLSVRYETADGPVAAVRDVTLRIARGEILGVVGESGCGKSSLAFAIMGYLGPSGRVSGEVRLEGENLLAMDPGRLRAIRGSRLSMVYQDPLSTLNPSLEVGEQIAEVYRTHRHASRADARARAVEMLARVGIGDPDAVAHRYPHQLSGGMQQRVVIAMALCCDPAVLILDEPTTALDVTTEARVLDLVTTLKREFRSAVLYISHNLGVIAQVCDRVAVMYAGEVVEESSVQSFFRQPLHPYGVGLLDCVPRLGDGKTNAPLRPIPGAMPSRLERSAACSFAPRCALADDVCSAMAPALVEAASNHHVRCHFWADVPVRMRRSGSVWRAAVAPREATRESGFSTFSREDKGDARQSPGMDVLDLSSSLWESEPEAGRSEGLEAASSPLLSVRKLTKHYGDDDTLSKLMARAFGRRTRPVRAVDGVSFDLRQGQTLALVGESGCGKTTLGRSIVGLLDVTDGQILFDGEDVSGTVEKRQPHLRRQIQMVFQNPEASLNPRHTVGYALERPLRRFLGLGRAEARRQAEDLLRAVHLDPGYVDRYPRQLSGGEKQRVAIARAFAAQPRMVILDEPVSALDVSVQAAVLNLLTDLQRKLGTTYVFIGHDLSVVRYVADWIGVIYLGKLCEFGPVGEMFHPPYHPYTEALLSAVPLPDPDVRRDRIRLDGAVPSPRNPPVGCPFHTRCPRKVGAICETTPPPAQGVSGRHEIRCHIPLEQLTALQT